MKKLQIKLSVILTVLLYSCAPTAYYQIYTVKSSQDNQQNNIVFSDERCQVQYNFWDRNGNAGFWFQNNTNQNIYIDMENCFFVHNNIAHDYFQNRIFEYSNAMSLNHSQTNTLREPMLPLFINNTEISQGIYSSNHQSVYFNEKKIICVPAKSMKYIPCEYSIVSSLYRNCDLVVYPSTNKHWDKNTKKYVYDECPGITFDLENSPIVFSNHITYYIDTPEHPFQLVTNFYVSQITNFLSDQIITYRNEETICGKSYYSPHTENSQYSPNKFYFEYYKYENGRITYDGH